MMTKVDASKPVQANLFKVMLRDIVFDRHELVLLKKAMLRRHSGYVKAKQFNRAENVVRTLKRYLTNVVDFAESQPVVPRSMRELGLLATLQECVARSRRLLA